MTETQITILTSLGIYFLLMIALGYFAAKKESAQGYIIGNRNVGYFRTMGSLAATFRDGAGIVFWTGAGLTLGYGGLWLTYGIIIGLLFFSFTGDYIRRIAEERNYITVGQVVRDNIGPLTRKLTSLIIVAFSMMLVAMQLYVSGNVIARILSFEPWIGISTVALVVGIYLYAGGYGNVIKTDAVQCVLILSLIVIPFFIHPTQEQLLDYPSLVSMGLTDSIALFLLGAFYSLTSAEAWQRAFSARDGRVIKIAFPSAGVIFLVMTISLIFLGFGAKHILPQGTEANGVFFALFENNVISAPLQAFIAIVAMAITMSTLSSASYLTASTLCKDILPEKRTEDNQNYIKYMRLFMVLILVSMSLVAITISDVIQFLFDAASLLFVLSPLYIMAILDKHPANTLRDRMLFMATALSTAVYIYLFSIKAFENMIVMYVPTTLNIFLALIIWLTFKIRPKANV